MATRTRREIAHIDAPARVKDILCARGVWFRVVAHHVLARIDAAHTATLSSLSNCYGIRPSAQTHQGPQGTHPREAYKYKLQTLNA